MANVSRMDSKAPAQHSMSSVVLLLLCLQLELRPLPQGGGAVSESKNKTICMSIAHTPCLLSALLVVLSTRDNLHPPALLCVSLPSASAQHLLPKPSLRVSRLVIWTLGKPVHLSVPKHAKWHCNHIFLLSVSPTRQWASRRKNCPFVIFPSVSHGSWHTLDALYWISMGIERKIFIFWLLSEFLSQYIMSYENVTLKMNARK